MVAGVFCSKAKIQDEYDNPNTSLPLLLLGLYDGDRDGMDMSGLWSGSG